MVRVCIIIFTTSRYEYLIPMLDSLNENVDFTGVDTYTILMEDYPLRRDLEMLDMIQKEYKIDQMVLNEENMGYSASWGKAWTLIPEDVDYIWHQEEDFVFEDDVNLLEMIQTFEKSPVRLSQLFLKRNVWYSGDNDFVRLIDSNRLGKEIISNNNPLVVFRYRWFIPHPGIYPRWISQEDYPNNPQEDVVASYLNAKYPDLHSGAWGSIGSKYMVNHIGEYNQGKRYSEKDPGWALFNKYDPNKQYLSAGYLVEYHKNHNFMVAELCSQKGYSKLAEKYKQLGIESGKVNKVEIKDEKYIKYLNLAKSNPKKARVHLTRATEIYPERLEAWYKLMMIYYNCSDWHRAYGYGICGLKSYQKHRHDIFLNKESSIYDSYFMLNLPVVALNAGYSDEAFRIAKMFDYSTAFPEHCNLHHKNMKFYSPSSNMKTIENKNVSRSMKYPTPSILIIDNFLTDPDKEREFALSQTFEVVGNYPGKRTKSFATDEDKAMFEHILGKKITYWPNGYNGSYQYCYEDMKSWVHRDDTTHSAIIFLTPDPPCQAGTTVYIHKATGKTFKDKDEDQLNKDSNDLTKWNVCDVIGNQYNRLVIFNGLRSHSSSNYFGNSKETSRLFKIFFFNVSN